MTWSINTDEGLTRAIIWQTRFISVIKDDGYWIVPRSRSVYQINKREKTATLKCGSDESVNDVFKAMGWKLIDGRNKT